MNEPATTATAATTISKDEVKAVLSELMKERVLFAPVSNGKKLDYMQVEDIEDIIFDDSLPYKSPKEIFFPRCEKIITFKDGDAIAETAAGQAVLFGARPCDLEALAIMKKIFTEGKFRDPFFEERYNNTLIIGVGCAGMKPGCFCNERETDMGRSDKCDLFLYAVSDGHSDGSGDAAGHAGDSDASEDAGQSDVDGSGGGYYTIRYVSEKGRAVLGKYISGLAGFENAPHDFRPAKTLNIDAEEEDLFEKIDWEKIARACQGCGVCTYICPTCHCFAFKDVDEGHCAYRFRNWDSCMFPKFTLHASGHNPRAAKQDRYRQRVAHKYLYVRKNFGQAACTGCGRCVRSCPAGINIKGIAEAIMEELK